MLAALAAVSLHFALPPVLRFGPPWVVAGLVSVCVAGAWVTRRQGMTRANSWFAYGILLVLTAGLLFGVGALLLGLVRGRAEATDLLRSAAVLWATNVIVFATWYWRLDAGGPNERERRDTHMEGAFLFPQMTFSAPADPTRTMAEHEHWRPHFVDYLFVAFNTSTAFSATDAPVLTKWAKVAMMVQSIISFTTIVVIAARAVNILPAGR